MSEHKMFTAVFVYDIQKHDGNPFHVETPFGKPCATGVGNVFAGLDEVAAQRDELLDALEEVHEWISNWDIQDELWPGTAKKMRDAIAKATS